uniref:Uncharacterized protein n=1 Tax=Helicotheca tamesis TaxID=374047 RepID=A0A7S2GPW4_9STRA|mmetsp:Transcript_10449/g.14633  ORF Transcript_10449/g.14633 Transcript_10449/m.14633 type:complete len:177 (+) Transcript_10449:67-597(+)
MQSSVRVLLLVIASFSAHSSSGFTSPNTSLSLQQKKCHQQNQHLTLAAAHDDDNNSSIDTTRRSAVSFALSSLFLTTLTTTPMSSKANAAADCMTDCIKSCKKIAPKDPEYCLGNCKDYCDQPDRTDGLSGSKSSDNGEMGILGTYTVVKGEDKPPAFNLPGLDFNTEKGKKLIGY